MAVLWCEILMISTAMWLLRLVCDKGFLFRVERIWEIYKNCINRAKRKLCFKIVDKECILKYGYDIIEDSYKHYKIKDRSMSKSDFISWIKYCNSEDYDFGECLMMMIILSG